MLWEGATPDVRPHVSPCTFRSIQSRRGLCLANLQPDDRSLAFWEIDESVNTSTLKVISTAGDIQTLLTVPYVFDAGYPQCGGFRFPLWTSDGGHLLNILDSVPKGEPFPSNPCKLYKVPVEGGDPIFVGAIPQHQRVWALSPDDNRLAFETGEFRGETWILQGLDRR